MDDGNQGTRRDSGVPRNWLVASGAAGGAVVAARKLRPLPVVLLHGILDCAENMEESAEWVREAIPGAYVRTLEVGNGIVDSISKPMQWQLEQLAAGLRADPKLRRGLHLIGHSQGSLLARAYVQRYNSPRVHTLVSWTGPQAGFFGVPDLEPLLKRANHWTSPMWY